MNYFAQFLSLHFLLWEIVNLNLTFAVCCNNVILNLSDVKFPSAIYLSVTLHITIKVSFSQVCYWIIIILTSILVRLKIPTAKGMIRVGSATVRSGNHRAPSFVTSGQGRITSPSKTDIDSCYINVPGILFINFQ